MLFFQDEYVISQYKVMYKFVVYYKYSLHYDYGYFKERPSFSIQFLSSQDNDNNIIIIMWYQKIVNENRFPCAFMPLIITISFHPQ